MKTVLRSKFVDPLLESAQCENSSNSATLELPKSATQSDNRNGQASGFWTNRWARVFEWGTKRFWPRPFTRRTNAEVQEPLEPYSGLSDLKESESYSALQHIVDDSQKLLDGESIHKLVDLALFSEGESSQPL